MQLRFSTFGPYIDSKDFLEVKKAISFKSWYNKPYYYCERFEKEFARYHNRKFGLLTPNCTSSIHLMLYSLNLSKNDEIIAPECTWIASVSPVIQERAKLILCDVDKKNFCISIESIKKNITKKTKVIISVNVYGNMADYNELTKLCKLHKIILIEDAAESLGSYYNKKKSGSFGDASVFSFHRTKTMTTGEGGILLLNNKKLYLKCKTFRDHGRTDRSKDLYNDFFALKYMPSNMQAALGYSQFKKINTLLLKKRSIFNHYKKYLSRVSHLINLNEDNNKVKNGCWATVLVMKKNNPKLLKKISNKLKLNNFFARPFFYPISSLPAYQKIDKNYKKFKKKNPNAYFLYKNGIVLPSSYILKKKDIQRICNIIIKKFI